MLDELCVPDDSGSDAFRRYRFQAHVAFPHCLDCATERRVVSLTCEHFEDLLIEEADKLRFTQIKTRNADYGPWRFTDLCRPRGGALTSLLRTHRALAKLDDERAVVYEIRLEGVSERGDPIRRLMPSGDGADESMAKTMTKALREATEIKLNESREVLARTQVRFVAPREHIEDENLRKLRALAGHLPANDLKAIYDAAIGLICTAMEGELLADAWPAVLFEPLDEKDERAVLVAGKRLRFDRLAPVFEPLKDGSLIRLEDVLEDDELNASAMIRKLRLAGATEPLLQRARSLRAAAAKREIEVRSRDMTGRAEVDFEDLDQRLLTAAVASAEAVGELEAPAGKIFADLLNRLSASPATYDPMSLLGRDGLALTGGVLQLSDECRFPWRRNA
jgi:hypothetical protein